ncbi:hypothetical protein BDV24DRAFT_176826 [Aspergillus arachidicola]|uniref:Uncharacterized protein n=1 Tax=Aspergillus arachidicola TaxID=656916 RepID=A0A5N6XYX9_9EURO|nr:hypothetical protein BDV24DRAFT_176826 [Aspergillus arachidicola]
MAESPASIIKLSLPLANEDLGCLIRRIEKHGPFENTLTVTFAQEHIITLRKVSQVQTSDDTLTKATQKARRVKSMQEHESISCAMEKCTYIHGLKVSCPKILEKRGCVMFFLSQLNPSHCKFGHDHHAARLFNYKEGSACHGLLDLEANKQRRLNGQETNDFGLVPRADTV